PTRPDNSYNSASMVVMKGEHSSVHEFPGRQTQQRIERGEQIIEHHAQSVAHRAVEMPDRRRLDDIEYAEQQECKGLPRGGGRRKVKHDQEGDGFVKYHAAVIVHSKAGSR